MNDSELLIFVYQKHRDLSNNSENTVQKLMSATDGFSIIETLQLVVNEFPGQVVFSTSFGFEDQLITHLITSHNLPIHIFTLDTGRMFPETYSVWNSTTERYHTPIEAYYPDAASLQKLVTDKGPNLFYESVENRKACCYVRKVEPLKRALAGNKIWITGLRAEQSANREGMSLFEWDGGNHIIKHQPLLHYTTDETWSAIRQHNVPYNPLHDRGFISIGCAPCTRAIRPGEDFRAGRWWWDNAGTKDCGLHVHTEAVADKEDVMSDDIDSRDLTLVEKK